MHGQPRIPIHWPTHLHGTAFHWPKPSPWGNHPPAHPSALLTIHWPTRLHGTTFHWPTCLHGTTFHWPTRLYHTPCPGPPVSVEQLPTSPPVCLAPCSLAQIPWPIHLYHILHSLPIPSNTFLYYPILYTTGPSLSIRYTLYSGPLIYIATWAHMGWPVCLGTLSTSAGRLRRVSSLKGLILWRGTAALHSLQNSHRLTIAHCCSIPSYIAFAVDITHSYPHNLPTYGDLG